MASCIGVCLSLFPFHSFRYSDEIHFTYNVYFSLITRILETSTYARWPSKVEIIRIFSAQKSTRRCPKGPMRMFPDQLLRFRRCRVHLGWSTGAAISRAARLQTCWRQHCDLELFFGTRHGPMARIANSRILTIWTSCIQQYLLSGENDSKQMARSTRLTFPPARLEPNGPLVGRSQARAAAVEFSVSRIAMSCLTIQFISGITRSRQRIARSLCIVCQTVFALSYGGKPRISDKYPSANFSKL